MAEDKLDKLEEKKNELEEELEKIQNELDSSLDKVREDVSTSLSPTEIIKRHPLPVVGLSVLIGFLAGSDRKKSHSNDSDGVSSLLLSEIKRLITKKGISMATDYIEDILLDDQERSSTDSDSVKKD